MSVKNPSAQPKSYVARTSILGIIDFRKVIEGALEKNPSLIDIDSIGHACHPIVPGKFVLAEKSLWQMMLVMMTSFLRTKILH